MIHFFLHVLGIDNVSGYWYGFWSGSGSIFIPPLLTATPIVMVQLRHKNCHAHGCLRLGRYKSPDGYIRCRIHHLNPLPGRDGCVIVEDIAHNNHGGNGDGEAPQ